MADFVSRPFLEVTLVTPESFRLIVGANALQGLRLNLADALARNAEFLSHLLKRVVNTVFKPVPQFQNLALLWREVVQNFAHLVSQNSARHFLIRRENLVILHEIAQDRLAVV